jgi:hypothetical protein
MSTKELLLAEIEKLDEPKLRAVYEFAQTVAAKNGTAQPKEKSFLEALGEIQIDDLPPDFSENFELYASGEKTYE